MFLNLGEIWDHVNFLVRKEKEGNVITPEDYNKLLVVVNIEVAEEIWKKHEETLTITDSLKRFERDEVLTIVEGVSTNFPSDYWHLADSGLRTTDEISIDLCTDIEWGKVLDDSVVGPTTEYPRAKFTMDQGSGSIGGSIYSKQILIRPKGITPLRLTYFKYPSQPVFDYCIDNNTDEIVYMEPNWSINNAGKLLNELGGTVRASVSHPTAALPHQSNSVEFDYEYQDVNKCKNLILQKISLVLRSGLPLQYSQQKEIQLNTGE